MSFLMIGHLPTFCLTYETCCAMNTCLWTGGRNFWHLC